MHIAICDDNIADRKHLERLLGRESDKRAGTPNLLYVDSYGDSKALLRSNPTMYDLFFIDLVETPTEAEETVASLLEGGVKAPITMCSSKIDYHNMTILPDNSLHLEKPYHVDLIEEVLEKAQYIKDHQVPTLEMRSTDGTRYVTRQNILYAYPVEENITVFQADGDSFEILGQPFEFYVNLKPYLEFFTINQKIIINLNLILKRKLFSVTMTDGKTFKLSWNTSLALKRRLKKLNASK